ncbi:hypothetical protein JCM1841_006213 [Sporobolomyces salmonicolor]
MRTFTTAFSIAALASVARSGGIIDNAIEAAKIAASASTLSGAGNYVFTNVATGQILSFTRNGDTTDFYPQDDGESLALQFAGNAARLSGGNNKCASAQWSYEFEGGVDYAAVSYACAVGSGLLTGTDTLEKTKQWWYIVPAGSASSSTSSSDASSSSSAAPSASASASSSTGATFNEAKFNALAQSKAAKTPSVSSSSSSAASAASTPSSSSSSSDALSLNEQLAEDGYYTTSSSSINVHDVDTSGVSSYNRSTWICRHPGWWLAAHQSYVTKAGHVECADDLKAYLAANPTSSRMTKRSRPSHHEMAQKLAKKGQQTYWIIAVDHILDMATRAIGSESLSTYGGYTSTTLSLWNQNDNSQLWTVTPA